MVPGDKSAVVPGFVPLHKTYLFFLQLLLRFFSSAIFKRFDYDGRWGGFALFLGFGFC